LDLIGLSYVTSGRLVRGRDLSRRASPPGAWLPRWACPAPPARDPA